MKPAVVFDLDGTLLDTLEDIVTVVNSVMDRSGLPSRTIDQVKAAVGRGVEELIRRLVPSCTEKRIVKLADDIRKEYLKLGSVRTRPFDGIPALLRNLQEIGIPLAVLTNKPQPSAEKAVNHHFSNVDFRVVRGVTPGGPLKPSIDSAMPLLRELGVAPSNTIMVGDSDIDMKTASVTGMYSVGVAWGFRDPHLLRSHGASKIIYQPWELLRLVKDRF